MLSLKKIIDGIDIASFLAMKNIFHNKKMLILIIAIISLGFLSTTFSTSVINGLKYQIEEKAISVMTGNVLIEPKEDEDFIYNVDEIVKKALVIPGVVGVSPHINRGITLVDKYGSKAPYQLKIIDPEKEAFASAIDNNILSGRYLSKKTTGEIFIGADLTKKYRMQEALPSIDADAGDKITAMFDNGVVKQVKVRGIYGLSFAATDIYVYITKEEAKQVFGMTDEEMDVASEIMIKTRDRGIEEDIIFKLKQFGITGKISSWQEKLGVINQFTDSILIVSKITGLIGFIIAFATIYIMIYINVMNKRSQIGIMKALGITKETILVSYIIQSFCYGIIGGLLGVILTRYVIWHYTINPIVMPIGDVVPLISITSYIYSFIILLLSSLFAGYFASQGVIKENILDAIFKG